MSFDDWGKLEFVRARLEDLCQRRQCAKEMGMAGRLEELSREIGEAEVQRSHLVDQIMGRVAGTA
jgi:hypothetical protein